ncbi:MAG: short-chain dehydrogenase, partial [Pseudomonadota bacterium]|nr:short-chain dehydrogenase [Pseudomonadota bacterium]
KGQQSKPHDPPGNKHNTWEPVYGAEVAAHGSFDDQAHAHSPELWLSQHRGLVGAAAAGVVASAIAAARR